MFDFSQYVFDERHQDEPWRRCTLWRCSFGSQQTVLDSLPGIQSYVTSVRISQYSTIRVFSSLMI